MDTQNEVCTALVWTLAKLRLMPYKTFIQEHGQISRYLSMKLCADIISFSHNVQQYSIKVEDE